MNYLFTSKFKTTSLNSRNRAKSHFKESYFAQDITRFHRIITLPKLNFRQGVTFDFRDT